ncbi:MAG TPA: hypothetical protein VMF06_10845, partial [Candidatus Limnocylindria bacterium]|nr:hypothetical protein [Candidatus Limnocylindria bacterium]
MKPLIRFWFTFEYIGTPSPLNLGCGVTAFDYEDATRFLRERVFAGREIPRILHFTKDVNVSL